MYSFGLSLCVVQTINCRASVDLSGVTGKIHMKKIRLIQDVARTCYDDGFHDWRALGKGKCQLRSPGVRAVSRDVGLTYRTAFAVY